MFFGTKKETISNKLKELRKTNKVSQADLADTIGVTRQTIISMEKGSYVPSLLLAMKIAKYFNNNVEDIFYLKIND